MNLFAGTASPPPASCPVTRPRPDCNRCSPRKTRFAFQRNPEPLEAGSPIRWSTSGSRHRPWPNNRTSRTTSVVRQVSGDGEARLRVAPEQSWPKLPRALRSVSALNRERGRETNGCFASNLWVSLLFRRFSASKSVSATIPLQRSSSASPKWLLSSSSFVARIGDSGVARSGRDVAEGCCLTSIGIRCVRYKKTQFFCQFISHDQSYSVIVKQIQAQVI